MLLFLLAGCGDPNQAPLTATPIPPSNPIATATSVAPPSPTAALPTSAPRPTVAPPTNAPTASPTLPAAATASPTLPAAATDTLVSEAQPTDTSGPPPPAPTPAPTNPAITPPSPSALIGGAGQIAMSYNGNLALVNPDGSNLHTLTSVGLVTSPRFSPDGGLIVYVQGSGVATELHLIHPDGSSDQPLTQNKGIESDPTWSHDGQTIAYSYLSDTNGDGKVDLQDNSEVWLINTDGSNPRKLGDGQFPSWRSDDLLLAFSGNGERGANAAIYGQNSSLHLINAKGQNEWQPLKITNVPQDLSRFRFPFNPGTTSLLEPRFSPVLTHTLALVAIGSSGLIVTVNDKGGEIKVWNWSYEGGFGRLAWSPTQPYLAYNAENASGVGSISISDIGGGQPGQTIASLGGIQEGHGYSEATWSPDGQRLALAQVSPQPGLAIADLATQQVRFVVDGNVNSLDWHK